MEYASDIYSNRKRLFNMLRDAWKGNYKMSFITIILLVLGILHIILPFDLDWIPIIGWIDDGFVAYWLLKRLLKETERYERKKQRYAGSFYGEEIIEDAEIVND